MKKRTLCLLLAIMMVCTLLPMGVAAAEMPVYKDLITGVASPDSLGVLKDLDGDGVEELFMIWENGDGPFGQIFTIENGKTKKLIEQKFTGPEITETNEFADLAIISANEGSLIVKTKEANTDAGLLENTHVYWNEGAMVFYQLANGELQQTDALRYKLLLEDGTDRIYEGRSTISLNDEPISAADMNKIIERVNETQVELYPMQQVYDAAQGFFQDVPAAQYYAVPVGWALDNNITKGTTNVDFSPNAPCTRAQVVTFLWRAEGSPKATSAANPFTDVAPGAYYYDAVLWAVEKGITSGTSATTFSPNDPCTRAQVVTFLWRYFGHLPMAGNNPFTDVKSGEYYRDAVLWALAKGVTQGESATTFGPNNTCTRGQIVTFLYRALKK